MTMTKAQPAMDKAQAKTWAKNFLQNFQNIYNQPNMTEADLEKIFTTNFQFTSNNQLLTKSTAEHMNRATKLRKKYAHFELKGLEEPVINENRIAVNYELNLRAHNGQKSQVLIMAIATLEGNKISQWSQVTHDKHSNPWDA
jgi:hypothetical protein